MKCYRCFQEYSSENKCPHCGQEKIAPDKEIRCLEEGSFLQEGRYEVGCIIGAGGFGVTYAAWDYTLQIRVAIKEYLPGEFATRAPGNATVSIYGGEKTEQFKDGLVKFYEESKRLAKFRGIAGIVQIFDVFMENETAYIVMEYLEGEALSERLKREAKIRYQDAVQIILPVLQALSAVHNENILHRDIAPNNIFLCSNGEVKLLDFGAARSATGTHSKSLTVLYKEGYTPEEQYRSRGEQGTWTDVYSCAATLYRMITGVVPQSALERRVKDELKKPSKYGNKVSKDIENAILNALNVEAKHRTKDVEQFMDELTGKVKNKKRFIRTSEKGVGRMSVRVRIVLTMISVLALLFVGLLSSGIFDAVAPASSQIDVPEGKARIPNLVNVDVEEARRKTEESGLSFMIKEKEFSTEIPENRVLKQELRAGTLVDEGMQLSVVVSAGINNMTVQELEENGIEVVEIPDLQYQDRDETLGMLLDAGLDVKIEYETTGIVEGGKITRQSLPVGEKVIKGQEIKLTIEDFIVDFTDSAFIEAVVRNVLAKESGDIWASEMLEIEEIDFEYSDIWDYSRQPVNESIAPLKNSLNLKKMYLRDGLTIDGMGKPVYEEMHRYANIDELEYLVQLENLKLDNLLLEDLNWIWRMKKLKVLDLYGCTIENVSLDIEFEELTYIYMWHTTIVELENETLFKNIICMYIMGATFVKIKEPEKMTELSHLGIMYVDQDAISNLEKFPELRILELMNTSIKPKDLVNINKLYKLRIQYKDVTADLEKHKNEIRE